MRCLLPIFLATALSQTPSPAFSAAPNALEPLSFLLGEWVAEGKSKPGGANGASTFIHHRPGNLPCGTTI
jgi:hypothetical protein